MAASFKKARFISPGSIRAHPWRGQAVPLWQLASLEPAALTSQLEVRSQGASARQAQGAIFLGGCVWQALISF